MKSFLFSLKGTDTGDTDTLLGTVEQQRSEKSMETKSVQGIVLNSMLSVYFRCLTSVS